MRTLRRDEPEKRNDDVTLEPEDRPAPTEGGLFPLGPLWELTPERVWRWFEHNFSGARGDSRYFRRGAALDDGELSLLLWDLDYYRGLCERYLRGQGPQPPPLDRYLQGYLVDAETGDPEECRQHWGEFARAIRELWKGCEQ